MQEYNDPEFPSKSGLKREMEDLQAYGERLMALKQGDLDRLPMTPRLRHGVDESRRIRSHEARRRHAQFIGRLMREENGEEVIRALEELDDPWRQRWLIDWQDRLMAVQDPKQAEALVTEVVERYPAADRQHLRNLCRNVLAARVDDGAGPAAVERYRRERRKLADALNDLERHQPL